MVRKLALEWEIERQSFLGCFFSENGAVFFGGDLVFTRKNLNLGVVFVWVTRMFVGLQVDNHYIILYSFLTGIITHLRWDQI